ncbi:DNRLRE domain-containing protein, partial [bacterium]|nr:DNRLRE domain-containing protein [bacterium]
MMKNVIFTICVALLVWNTAEAQTLVADTYVNMRHPDTNYGSDVHMEVANRYGSGSSDWERNILIEFDLWEDPPPWYVLHSATLYLYYYGFDDTDPAGRELTIQRITDPWDEYSVTYNTQPACDLWPSSSSAIVPSAPGWMSWDVTGLVEAIMFSYEFGNYGWKIMDENPWGMVNIPVPWFYTKEHGTLIPYLDIDMDTEMPVCPPIPEIWVISPNPANVSEMVSFGGEGVSGYEHDCEWLSADFYSWRSSLSGVLSDQPSFSTDTLSAGTHTIYFKVRSEGYDWSNEVSRTLEIVGITQGMVAVIDSIRPAFSALEGQEVCFYGHGEGSEG